VLHRKPAGVSRMKVGDLCRYWSGFGEWRRGLVVDITISNGVLNDGSKIFKILQEDGTISRQGPKYVAKHKMVETIMGDP